MKKVNVYLAGGFKSGWQDKVKEACKDLLEQGMIEWNDPRENNTRDPNKYGPMDRMRLDVTEIIFGYAEKDNPLPFPLFFEMGYGLGKGYLVIFVNEITEDDPRHRPMLFPTVFGCGWVLTENILAKGIDCLREQVKARSAFYKRVGG